MHAVHMHRALGLGYRVAEGRARNRVAISTSDARRCTGGVVSVRDDGEPNLEAALVGAGSYRPARLRAGESVFFGFGAIRCHASA